MVGRNSLNTKGECKTCRLILETVTILIQVQLI